MHTLDYELSTTLHNNETDAFNDGMDISLVRVDKTTLDIQFSGALRSIMILDENGVTEVRGSRYPLGFYPDVNKKFERVDMKLQKGACV